MSADELAALLIFATAMSFTPGPNTHACRPRSAPTSACGARWRFVVAVPAGWTLMMLACGLGLAALVAGGAGLRGGQVGRHRLPGVAGVEAGRARARSREVDAKQLDVGFWQGVGLQFVNIKAWMLALALAAGWVTSAGSQPRRGEPGRAAGHRLRGDGGFRADQQLRLRAGRLAAARLAGAGQATALASTARWRRVLLATAVWMLGA